MKSDCYEIEGGNKLFGEVKVQSSKNATLPIMSASLLAGGVVELINYPHITDVDNMIKILNCLGAEVSTNNSTIAIDPTNCKNTAIDCNLAKTMRSSIFLLGALLNKFKQCKISMPGGCNIGSRPIDVHIKALKKLKVKVTKETNFLHFDATNARSGKVKLKLPSVGATENLIQFACGLSGKTVILNPAKEPEVKDLCNFLNMMGAKIIGAGTNKITIYGVDKLKTTQYILPPDRIVTGTLMLAVAICGGKVTLKNVRTEENLNLINKLVSIGCKINSSCDIITITSNGELKNLKHICTGFYPKFATDLQSLMLVACCVGKGKCVVTENLFENRFLTAKELQKMGANIKLKNSHNVKIEGSTLKGTTVLAQDLRGGAALVLAGLKATGTTIVKNAQYINRGYDNLVEVLSSLGASIKSI